MGCVDCSSSKNCFLLGPSIECMEIVEGAYKIFEAEIMDGYGNPIDITNDTIVFTVKDKFGGTLKLKKTNTPGMHIDSTNGLTSFTILHTDIPSISPYEERNWVYEIRRINVALHEDIHIQGDFIVNPSVGV